jgi:hypothetical protein
VGVERGPKLALLVGMASVTVLAEEQEPPIAVAFWTSRSSAWRRASSSNCVYS